MRDNTEKLQERLKDQKRQETRTKQDMIQQDEDLEEEMERQNECFQEVAEKLKLKKDQLKTNKRELNKYNSEIRHLKNHQSSLQK